MHARAKLGILLGCTDHGVYRLELISGRKINEPVRVKFDENCFPGLEKTGSSIDGASSDYEDPNVADDEETEEMILSDSDSDCRSARRPQRLRRSPERYGQHAVTHNIEIPGSVISIPITISDTPTLSEAMSATGEELKLWKLAIEKERQNLSDKGTWIKVGRQLCMSSRWYGEEYATNPYTCWATIHTQCRR